MTKLEIKKDNLVERILKGRNRCHYCSMVTTNYECSVDTYEGRTYYYCHSKIIEGIDNVGDWDKLFKRYRMEEQANG